MKMFELWLLKKLIFMEKIFWIPNVSKSYPNCIHVFSNKTGGEKEAKVLKMDNKGQYYAITYTKIKQIYA